MTTILILALMILAVAAMGVLVALGHTPDSRCSDYGVGPMLAPRKQRR